MADANGFEHPVATFGWSSRNSVPEDTKLVKTAISAALTVLREAGEKNWYAHSTLRPELSRFGTSSPQFWADISALAGREIKRWDDLYENELQNLVLKFYADKTALEAIHEEIVQNNFRGTDYGLHTGEV